MVTQHRFGDVLVHADGGRQDAGADVRHAERLEVSLEDAILTEGPVQGGEDDGARRQADADIGEGQARILAHQGVRRGQRLDIGHIGHIGEDPIGVDPLLVVRESDHLHGEPALERSGDDPTRRDARHFVLSGRAPVDDRQHSGIRHRPRLYNRPRA